MVIPLILLNNLYHKLSSKTLEHILFYSYNGYADSNCKLLYLIIVANERKIATNARIHYGFIRAPARR